ncbi:MAG TPA: DM13 domain-containing protein [Blastocatellia bacterium]|nr:DM13 domain-containing protein [Blastocatellia bacterium]
MKIRVLVVIAILVVIAGGWSLFRPERLFINNKVNEALPVAQTNNPSSIQNPTTLYTGAFHSVAHNSMGTATVLQLADGKRLLRFTGFETSNGPDVRVYLVAANDASDSQTVTSAGFVELGALKGNIGDQNYDLPGDIDLTRYRAVTIWCKRFSVNFGTAPLQPTMAKQS